MEAFPDISTSTATLAMQEVASAYQNLFDYSKFLSLKPHVQLPKDGTSTKLLELMSNGILDFQSLGVNIHLELGFLNTHLKTRFPLNEMIGKTVVEALLKNSEISNAENKKYEKMKHQMYVIDILHVGLRRGQNATWRAVVPVALEQFSGQWRLRAHDLSDPDYTVKSFALFRILQAIPSRDTVPKNFTLGTGDVRVQKYEIFFNPLLTPDQLTALSQEIGVKPTKLNDVIKNIVYISDTALFDFQKMYMETTINNSDIVWPLVEKLVPNKE